MKVTITAYRGALMADGQVLGIPPTPVGTQVMVAAGTATALPDETNIIRVATDTAIHINVTGAAATTADPYVPAGVEYFGAEEGVAVTIIAG